MLGDNQLALTKLAHELNGGAPPRATVAGHWGMVGSAIVRELSLVGVTDNKITRTMQHWN